MYHKAELDYLLRILQKMHIPAQCQSLSNLADKDEAETINRYLDLEQKYVYATQALSVRKEQNYIFRMSNRFGLCFLILFLHKDEQDPEALIVGPYSIKETSREEWFELAESLDFSASQMAQLVDYCANVSVICDETPLLTMVIAFGETIWGNGDCFEIVDMEQDIFGPQTFISQSEEATSAQSIMQRMQRMEQRYAYENELMDLVSQGHYHRAEMMLSNFTGPMFEQRTADPLRNLKNYGVICNTLLRKAAERGGVHPIHLDAISDQFARRIESGAELTMGTDLILDMVRSYCRLVRKYAMGQWSPTIQKSIAYIEADLAGDLGLRQIASALNISAGYLSTLFKKETGQTLTEYISRRRMETGAHLLRTTRLQVQTVAQRCGMSDVNYFSKLFKKYTGKSPIQYRKELQH